MNKVFRKLQTAVISVLRGSPNRSFSLDDLVTSVCSDLPPIEKKYRAAVMRAAKRVVAEAEWSWLRAASRGAAILFFNPYDVRSYCHAQLRLRWWRQHFYKLPERLDRFMDPNDPCHDKDAIPNGLWHQDVARWIAVREENPELSTRLRNQRRRQANSALAALRIGMHPQSAAAYPVPRKQAPLPQSLVMS
jgi:hypothetical protein